MTSYDVRVSDLSLVVCSSDPRSPYLAPFSFLERARHEAAERIGLVIGERLALGEAESLVQRDRGFESPARSGFQAEALEAVGLRGIDDMIEHMRGDALPQEGFGGAHRLDLAMLRIEHFERAAPCEFVIAVDRPEGHAARAEAVEIEKVTAARRRVREHAREMLLEQRADRGARQIILDDRSEEHTSELQSLMRIPYA